MVMTCIACCFWNINHISTAVLFKWCIMNSYRYLNSQQHLNTSLIFSVIAHTPPFFPACWEKAVFFFLHQFEVQIDVEWSHMLAFVRFPPFLLLHTPKMNEVLGGGAAQPCSLSGSGNIWVWSEWIKCDGVVNTASGCSTDGALKRSNEDVF